MNLHLDICGCEICSTAKQTLEKLQEQVSPRPARSELDYLKDRIIHKDLKILELETFIIDLQRAMAKLKEEISLLKPPKVVDSVEESRWAFIEIEDDE